MRVQYSVETTPFGENCVQVGHPECELLSKIECEAYMDMLNRTFKRKPEGVYFVIKKNPYDCPLGYYLSVDIVYNDAFDNQEKFATKVMNNLPEHWDDVAKKRLIEFPEYRHWMIDPKTSYHDAIHKPQMDDDVREAMKLIESKGGIVIMEESEKEIPELEMEERKDTWKSVETMAKEAGMDVTDYIIQYAMEDVVPSCCAYGCEVEPDGICSHGQQSILLAYGMI